MNVTLLNPPSSANNTIEPFVLPNLAIVSLAAYLREKGHEVKLVDLEANFHRKMRLELKRVDFELLKNSRLIRAYLLKKLSASEAAPVKKIEKAFLESFCWSGTQLLCITLKGEKTLQSIKDPSQLNAAALIANGLKNELAIPVVIGTCHIPPYCHREILAAYPPFDYAVYARQGFLPLENIINTLEGKTPPLYNTFVRTRKGGLVHHPQVPPVITPPVPDYKAYRLEDFRLTTRDLLSRYDLKNEVFGKLLASDRTPPQLLALHQFMPSCANACLFCSAERSDEVPDVDDVMQSLTTLKEKGATGIYFINTSFNKDYGFADKLCDKLIKARLGLLWTDSVNVRALDEKLLAKMRKAGAVKLVFGVETGSDRLLKKMCKGATAGDVLKYLELSHKLGIWNHLDLIAGLPFENDRDIAATEEFLRQTAQYSDYHTLSSFELRPDSPFQKQPAKFGLIPHPARKFVPTPDGAEYLVPFDEKGGLRWKEKTRQIEGATETIRKTLWEISSQGAFAEQCQMHLLLYLYRRFGHDKKKVIRGIMRQGALKFRPYYEEAFFVMPDSYKNFMIF